MDASHARGPKGAAGARCGGGWCAELGTWDGIQESGGISIHSQTCQDSSGKHLDGSVPGGSNSFPGSQRDECLGATGRWGRCGCSGGYISVSASGVRSGVGWEGVGLSVRSILDLGCSASVLWAGSSRRIEGVFYSVYIGLGVPAETEEHVGVLARLVR